MRIGFDLTPLCVPQSGVGTYARNLWHSLASLPGDELLPLAHQRLYRAAGPGGPRLNKTLWMQLVLPWQLSLRRVHVAHFTNGVAPLWSPCPSVVTMHDMTLWLHPELHYSRRLVAMRPFIGPAARRARAVIAVSHSTACDAIRLLRLPPEKVHIIPEAPDPAFQPLPRAAARAYLRAWSLPERFLLFAGTLEPRKNLVRLLEAFACVRQHAPDLGLVLAGQRGWKDDDIPSTVERLGLDGAVRFAGHVPRAALVALYNLAEALVFPSLHEGFGLPVIEAMACGTPAITSPNGALRETGGEAAVYVDPLQVESIAAAISRLLTDAGWREDRRARGLARAAELSWAATARQTRAVYAQVAG